MRILYIDIDSLRPDHLGCYGWGRPTSPNIDRLAAEGVRFNQVYTSDMPCMPSRTSLFSGRFGIRHGCVCHTGQRAEPYPEGSGRSFRSNWAETSWMNQLRRAGYRTATISSFAERHAAWHWYAGFRETFDTGLEGHEICDHVIPQTLGWLQQHGRSEDWFLHINLWDVHVPYRTPASAGNRFADTPLPDCWLDAEQLALDNQRPGLRSASNALFLRHADKRPDINPAALATTDDVKLMHDGYDTAISYVDGHIGAILAALDALAIGGETAILISADHGECLGELGAYGGHCYADACTARVPLIIRWPGVTDAAAGTAQDGMHYHFDMAATVCHLLDIPIPDPWDATSMASTLTGEANCGRDELILSQLAQACQRSLVFSHAGQPHLYLRSWRSGFSGLPREMLFNLADDPHEQRDLAPSRPDLVGQAAGRLTAWQTQTLAGASHPDPLATVLDESFQNDLPSYIERLKRCGRDDLIGKAQAIDDAERQRYEHNL